MLPAADGERMRAQDVPVFSSVVEVVRVDVSVPRAGRLVEGLEDAAARSRSS